MTVVEDLKEIKKRNGYTDREIAEKTGYSRAYVNQVLNGIVPMRPAEPVMSNDFFSLIYTHPSRRFYQAITRFSTTSSSSTKPQPGVSGSTI